MVKNSNILITGGYGRIGSLMTFGIKPTRKQLDISDVKSIKKAFEIYKPSVLLHLAALTDISLCQQYPDRAYEVNVMGTFNIAKLCKEKGVKIVYMSSCTIFDGIKKTPYNENDKPAPIHVYGQTKTIGEWIVQDMIPNYLIIRTGWLFGNNKENKGFFSLCLNSLRNNKDFTVTTLDRLGSPTYIPDLVKTINQLINRNAEGVYHVVNKGKVSYFEIGEEIRKLGKFQARVIKEKNSQLKVSERGKMEALTSIKIKLRSWQDALAEYLNIN